MISTQKVYARLEKQTGYISVVELAMMLGANTSEVRQRLNELGDRVAKNEHDEWRVVDSLIEKLDNSSLSESEIKERNELENTVSQAFFLAGQALKTLRNKRLYRETHSTFEAYVKDRFDFKKSAAYYLINASEVVENLKRPQFVDKNQNQTILPSKESQCRPMSKLSPEEQRQVWSSAVEKAGGKVPSGRIIKEVVNEIKGVKSKMFSQPKKEGPHLVPGIGIEYIATLDEETYYLLQAYKEENGIATNNGAIRRLLDEKNQKNR